MELGLFNTSLMAIIKNSTNGVKTVNVPIDSKKKGQGQETPEIKKSIYREIIMTRTGGNYHITIFVTQLFQFLYFL